MGWAFAYPSSIHSVGGEEADQRPETEDSPTFLVISPSQYTNFLYETLGMVFYFSLNEFFPLISAGNGVSREISRWIARRKFPLKGYRVVIDVDKTASAVLV